MICDFFVWFPLPKGNSVQKGIGKESMHWNTEYQFLNYKIIDTMQNMLFLMQCMMFKVGSSDLYKIYASHTL